MTVCNWSRRWVASGARMMQRWSVPSVFIALQQCIRMTMLAAQVDEGVRQARRDELVSLQQGVGRTFAEALSGREARPPAGRRALAPSVPGAAHSASARPGLCRPARAGLGASRCALGREWCAGPCEQVWARLVAALSREGRAGGRARGRLQRRGRAGRPHAVVRPPAASVLERGAACAGRRLRAFRQCRQTATAFHGVCAQCLYKPRDFFILEHPWFLLPCVLVCYPARTLLSEY